MHDVADNYIEIVKSRLWNPNEFGEDTKRAQKALYYVLFNSLKGFSPIMPFVTEEIYQVFYKQFEKIESIHLTEYPIYNKNFANQKFIDLGNRFVEVVGIVRRYKAEKQLSMKAEIEKLEITCDDDLKIFVQDSLSDLKAVTSAKKSCV